MGAAGSKLQVAVFSIQTLALSGFGLLKVPYLSPIGAR